MTGGVNGVAAGDAVKYFFRVTCRDGVLVVVVGGGLVWEGDDGVGVGVGVGECFFDE